MGDKPLTQDEIDSLISANPPKKQALPRTEKASPAATISRAVSQSHEEAAAVPAVRKVFRHDAAPPQQVTESPAGSVDSPGTSVTELEQRLGRVETVIKRLERLESVMGGAEGIAHQSPEELQAVIKRVQQLSEDVRIISAKLQGTLGYDVYHSFKCDSCSSQGTVAISLKCTKCGRESWRGWGVKR